MALADTAPAHDTDYARGVVLVLTAGVMWSIAGVVVRLMHDVTEWQILLYRSLALIATLSIFIALRNRGQGGEID